MLLDGTTKQRMFLDGATKHFEIMLLDGASKQENASGWRY